MTEEEIKIKMGETAIEVLNRLARLWGFEYATPVFLGKPCVILERVSSHEGYIETKDLMEMAAFHPVVVEKFGKQFVNIALLKTKSVKELLEEVGNAEQISYKRFHELWTAAVGQKDYKKRIWQDIAQELGYS
jgi:hypothetical protein